MFHLCVAANFAKDFLSRERQTAPSVTIASSEESLKSDSVAEPHSDRHIHIASNSRMLRNRALDLTMQLQEHWSALSDEQRTHRAGAKPDRLSKVCVVVAFFVALPHPCYAG